MIATIVGGTLAFILGFFVAPEGARPFLIFGFLVWLIWAFLALGIENKRDQTRLGRLGDWLPLPYDWVMGQVLRGLPRMLLPPSLDHAPKPPGSLLKNWEWYTTPCAQDAADLRRLTQNPWSWPVLDFALRAAIVYPIWFAMAQWAITDNATGLETVSFFPENTHWALRWAAFCLITSAIIGRIAGSVASRATLEERAAWFYFGATSTALVVAFTLEIAFAIAVVGAFAFEGAGAIATVLGFALALAGANVIAIKGAGAFVIMFLFAATIALALAGGVSWATRHRHGMLGYIALMLLAGGTVLTAVMLTPSQNRDIIIWLVGLTFLPLLNAFFDYLSYGLTIWLLREGSRRRGLWPWILGLADALAAALIFFCLSLTLATVLAAINLQRSEPLLDLRLLLTGLRDHPGDHIWVVAMVASTLLPTLVHIAIAILSAVTWIPARAWKAMTAALDGEVSAQRSLVASFALTLALAGYAAIPAAALYGVGWSIWQFGGPVRVAYIDTIIAILSGWGMV